MSAIAASSSSAGKRRRSCEISCALLSLVAIACGDAPPRTTVATRSAAPSLRDGGDACADIGENRVCWRGASADLVPRALPAGPVSSQGFRCGGAGAERVCEDRARNGSAFECGKTRCLQERPRMPDDGEWECVELSGIVYCHSRGVLAGAASGPMDLGWQCGARRGGGEGERICVDLDPDRPPLATHRQCSFELRFGMQQRSCAATKGLIAGDACDGASACPDGTHCEAGLCLPARPDPACWLDRDCGAGSRCSLGSCAKAGT